MLENDGEEKTRNAHVRYPHYREYARMRRMRAREPRAARRARHNIVNAYDIVQSRHCHVISRLSFRSSVPTQEPGEDFNRV